MITAGLLAFVALMSFAQLPGPSLRTIQLNNQGAKLMQEQKPEEAIGKFSRALETDPGLGAIHVNMGVAFEQLGQPEKALQAYRTAEKIGDDPRSKFMALFNQGALHQKAKKTDEALKAYHAALDVNPESRETKINIELLIQSQQSEQKQGEGEGESKDDKDQKDNKDKKDQKGKGQDDKDKKEQDPKKDGEQKKEQPKEYAKNKPQPRPFKSDDLSPGDVKKILGELRNQEQKIRSEYNKREVKESPRDKDW